MKKSIGGKTLVFPAPVLIVGTYDNDHRPNVMAVAWGGICCSQPPCVAVSLRKATYSYGNIVSRQAFTVNIPSEEQVREADYFGMASGRDEDKFQRSGLTPVASQLVVPVWTSHLETSCTDLAPSRAKYPLAPCMWMSMNPGATIRSPTSITTYPSGTRMVSWRPTASMAAR